MKILILDNYDSFTYNLAYILRQESIDNEVIRNDKIEVVDTLKYDGILLSPGPGIPQEAGNMPDIIKYCAGKIPILGICLGHQAIAQFLGAEIINRNDVLHGIQSRIFKTTYKSKILNGFESGFLAGRYHSWEVNKTNIPEQISVTAVDKNQSIMAIEAHERLLYGLQFHPESVLTPDGKKMIQNFIQICKTL
jgi:anthranilate synthase/aminodeoxychorismate synthase-like glutamine amidotransferase